MHLVMLLKFSSAISALKKQKRSQSERRTSSYQVCHYFNYMARNLFKSLLTPPDFQQTGKSEQMRGIRSSRPKQLKRQAACQPSLVQTKTSGNADYEKYHHLSFFESQQYPTIGRKSFALVSSMTISILLQMSNRFTRHLCQSLSNAEGSHMRCDKLGYDFICGDVAKSRPRNSCHASCF